MRAFALFQWPQYAGGMKWGGPTGGSWLKEVITTAKEGGDKCLIEFDDSRSGK